VCNDDAITTSGARITSRDDLSTRLVLLPKLFRRVAEYFTLTPGGPSLTGFTAVAQPVWGRGRRGTECRGPRRA